MDGNRNRVPQPQEPSAAQKFAVGVVMGIALLYLINPTAGILEFIPDNLPVLGNLDEATAMALIVSGLNFFGVSPRWLTQIFGPGKAKRREPDVVEHSPRE